MTIVERDKPVVGYVNRIIFDLEIRQFATHFDFNGEVIGGFSAEIVHY